MNNIKEEQESLKARGLQIVGEAVGYLGVLQIYQETVQREYAGSKNKPICVLYK